MDFDFLTPQEAMAARMALKDMNRVEKEAYLELLNEKEGRAKRKKAMTNPIEFAKYVYPNFKVGPHH